MKLTPNQFKLAVSVATILLVIFVGGLAFYLGDYYALDNLAIEQITPNQAANAMKGDYFYSNYREDSLMMEGKINSVSKTGNNFIIGFSTGSSFKTYCQLSKPAASIHTR